MVTQLAELPCVAIHLDISFARTADDLPFMGGVTRWIETHGRTNSALPANQANRKITVFVLIAHAAPLPD